MDRRLLVITANVPASVANLGAGYDCLALALELHNHFRLYCDLRNLSSGEKEFEFRLVGNYAGTDIRMNTHNGNLFTQAFNKTREYLCKMAGHKVPHCPIYVYQEVNIAPIRGLGSSSTASVAGILAAIKFVEAVYPELQPTALLKNIPTFQHSNLNDIIASLAMSVDSCPDNLCASLSGGLTYSLYDADREVPWGTCPSLHFFTERIEDPDLWCIALVPSIPLSTPAAKKLLGHVQYEIDDVAFNISRSTCLPAVLRDKRYHLLRAVTQDRVHQTQRAKEFYKGERKEINLEYVFQTVLEAGAYATFIGGAGSALIALVDVANVETVKEEFVRSFNEVAAEGWEVEAILSLRISNKGAECDLRDGKLEDRLFVKHWLEKSGSDWVPLNLGPEQPVGAVARASISPVDAVRQLKRVSLKEHTVVGEYRRYSEQVRNTLGDWRKRIESPLLGNNPTRENFLIWAASGNGKSFFVEQIAKSNTGRFHWFELNFAKLGKTEFIEEFARVREYDKPALCLLDEVDARPDEIWPYEECFADLDLGKSGRAIVFVLVGSHPKGLDGMLDAMRIRPKGADLLTRIPMQNRFSIPPLTIEDRAIVILSQLISAAAKRGRQLRQIEQLALYYALTHPELSDLRQLRDLCGAAIGRLSDGEERLKYDDMFDKEGRERYEFWAANGLLARELSNQYVTIED